MKILIRLANREVTPRKRVTVKKRSRNIQAEVKREMEKSRSEGWIILVPTANGVAQSISYNLIIF